MKAQIPPKVNKRKNIWRVVLLLMILLAIAGPWFFDHIFVPSSGEYFYSGPAIRLDENFVGMPVSGVSLFRWFIVDGFVYGTAGLVKGALSFNEWARESLPCLLFFLPLLPFFSTLLLILCENRRCQVFNIVAWGLGAGIGLLIGVNNYPRLFWMLWGVWLYMGLAAIALILEVRMLMVGRKPGQV